MLLSIANRDLADLKKISTLALTFVLPAILPMHWSVARFCEIFLRLSTTQLSIVSHKTCQQLHDRILVIELVVA
jgi:hypothetical protein